MDLRSPKFTSVRAGVTCHSHTLGHSITATVTTKSSSVQQVSASVYSISKSRVTRHQLIAGGWAECSRQVCPVTAVVTRESLYLPITGYHKVKTVQCSLQSS